MSRLFTMMSLTSVPTIALWLCWGQDAFSQQPQIVAVSPSQNQIASTVQPQITATFSVPIDPTTITSISFSIFGERSGYMSGAFAYDSIERRATFLPTSPFIAGERVIASLSRSITTPNEDSLAGYGWTFRIPSARRNELRFENAVVYGGGGWSIQCVDMNNDGYADIVSSGGVIRLNNGSGTFNAFWTLPGADPFSKIAADDFNRDGMMDVLYNANGLRIALSQGNGNFNIQSRPSWFDHYITGDFNSDGFPDIAGVTTSGDAWGISFNDGSGLFLDTVITGRVQGILTAMEAFDVDNDGHIDILCAGFPINGANEDGIAVWKGDGLGGFDGPYNYVSLIFSGPEQLYYSDFSNDGLADIAVRGYVGSLSLNLGGIFGTDTSSTREFWPAEAPGAMTGGDFNGDGWIDLMVSGWRLVPFDTTRFTGYAIIPNCKSTFRNCIPWPGWISDTLGYDYLVRSVQAVDVDNDGDLDIVHSYSAIYVNFNTSPPVSVRERVELPRELHVDQNFPNPFNSETIIRYRVPTAQRIRVQVYDTFGKEVKQLHNAVVAPGEHVVRWDGTNENLYRIASGVYFVRFLSSNSTEILKVLHLK
jgi:hypothetical protein